MNKKSFYRAGSVRAVIALVLGVSLGVIPAVAASAESTAPPASVEPQATPYAPVVGSDSARAAGDLVAPIDMGCPAGTSAYPGTLARFNCISTYRDNANVGPNPPIGIRVGEAVATSSFGIEKVQFLHGLNELSVATVVVNNAAGIEQENGNIKYGLVQTYNDFPTGVVVEVIIQQEPSNEDVAPDQFNLGLITAYCVGYDGLCPPGINEAITASIAS